MLLTVSQRSGLLSIHSLLLLSVDWKNRFELIIKLKAKPLFLLQRKRHAEECGVYFILRVEWLLLEQRDRAQHLYCRTDVEKLEWVQRRTLRVMKAWKNMGLTEIHSSNNLSNKNEVFGGDPSIINK